MMEFMAATANEDSDKDLTRESLFRSMAQKRYSAEVAQFREDTILDEIDTITSLRQTIEDDSNTASECLKIANFASKETKEEVEAVLRSKSKYINTKALLKYLKKDTNKKLTANDVVDKESLIKDMKEGKVLQDFLRNYKQASLDVVSLHSIRTLV